MAKLKKSIGFWVLLLISINAIIGTGVFFTPAIAASIAGPASLISWVLAAIVSVAIAACFAELSSMFPKSGGVYEYTKHAFGNFTAFLVGWSGWVIANIVIAMVVVGGIEYLSTIWSMSYFMKMAFAFGFVIIINFISYRGMDFSAKILTFFGVITISVLAAFIFFGAPHVEVSNLEPFFVFPKIAIFGAVFLVLETFFGWESISYLAEEVKDAKKNLPKAFVIATALIALLSVAAAFISITVVPWDYLGTSSTAMATVMGSVMHPWVATTIIFLIFFNIIGTGAAWIVSTPRLIYAMAREKDIPESLSIIHPKHKTPQWAILFQTVVTCFVLGSGSFRLLLGVAVPLAILVYSATILSVTKLRIDHPNMKRGFKVPFGRVLPVLIVIFLAVSMVLGTTIYELALGLVFVLLGLPLYMISILGYEKGFIRWFSDRVAGVTYWTYNFFVMKYIMPHILNFLSDPTIEKVADYGCGVGHLSHQIAKHVIPTSGKVYGVDFSKNEIRLAKKHQEKRDVKNLEFHVADLYNIKADKELNKKLRKLDAIVSIGLLQYLPDVDAMLKKASRRMRKKGKIYFVDYDYVGKLFEKPWIEHDDQIKSFFKKAGFDVRIWRQKRLFYHFVHIYGIKI